MRKSRPDFNDGCPRPGDTSPLDEQKLRTLRAVGNKRKANKMCRPTRFHPLCEEKLEALRLVHESRQFNPDTGLFSSISLGRAAEEQLMPFASPNAT